MRLRARRPGADDELGPHRFGTLLVEDLHEIPGDVALASADEVDIEEPLEGTVGDRGRPAQEVELALVLHGA